jgi:hypothetical protein
MAQFNGNSYFLSIDGIDLSGYVIDIVVTPSANTVDTTAGANTTHMQRKAALSDTKVKVTMSYDDTNLASYIQKMNPGGEYALIIGTEGATSGKPKHVADFLLVGAPFTVTTKKEPVAFELDFEGADAPSVNMFTGGVWS